MAWRADCMGLDGNWRFVRFPEWLGRVRAKNWTVRARSVRHLRFARRGVPKPISLIGTPRSDKSLRRHVLKWIGWWLIVLIAVGWMTCEIELPLSSQRQRDTEQWRRGNRGWEDTSAWFTPGPKREPLVDPLFFGALELFLSVAALSTLSSGSSNRSV